MGLNANRFHPALTDAVGRRTALTAVFLVLFAPVLWISVTGPLPVWFKVGLACAVAVLCMAVVSGILHMTEQSGPNWGRLAMNASRIGGVLAAALAIAGFLMVLSGVLRLFCPWLFPCD